MTVQTKGNFIITVKKKEERFRKEGIFSFFGLILSLCSLIAYANGDVLGMIGNISEFYSGNINAVPEGANESLGTLVVNICIILIAMIVVGMVIKRLAILLIGPVENDKLSIELDKFLQYGPAPFFLCMVFEEFISRWLPLGFLARFFEGAPAFYVLLFLGNLGFALLHIGNFDGKDRHILRVVPHFFGACILSYVFVRYGFWIVVLVHFLYDMIIFTFLKKQRVTGFHWASGLYFLLVFLGSLYFLVSKGVSLETLAPWWNSQNGLTPLPGFEFADYFFLLLCISSGFEVVSTLLMLDRPQMSKTYDRVFDYLKIIPISIVVFVSMVIVMNWILGFFIANALVKAVMISVIFALMLKTKSGSAIAHLSFVWVPSMFVFVSVVSFLSFTSSVMLMIVISLVNMPEVFINPQTEAHTT